MEMTKPFVRSLLSDKVKLNPKHLDQNLPIYILRELQRRYEGKCTYHGFILPYSISIHSYSMGKTIDLSLNGDVEFLVQYHADLCNPAVGSIMKAKVTKTSSKTNYAHFAEIFIDVEIPKKGQGKKSKQLSIIEIVLLKKISVRFEDVRVGDEVHVEIMGKKFQLNDQSISAWGKIVEPSSLKTLLDDVQNVEETDIKDEIDGDNENDLDSDDESTYVKRGEDLSDVDEENDPEKEEKEGPVREEEENEEDDLEDIEDADGDDFNEDDDVEED